MFVFGKDLCRNHIWKLRHLYRVVHISWIRIRDWFLLFLFRYRFLLNLLVFIFWIHFLKSSSTLLKYKNHENYTSKLLQTFYIIGYLLVRKVAFINYLIYKFKTYCFTNFGSILLLYTLIRKKTSVHTRDGQTKQ